MPTPLALSQQRLQRSACEPLRYVLRVTLGRGGAVDHITVLISVSRRLSRLTRGGPPCLSDLSFSIFRCYRTGSIEEYLVSHFRSTSQVKEHSGIMIRFLCFSPISLPGPASLTPVSDGAASSISPATACLYAIAARMRCPPRAEHQRKISSTTWRSSD